MNRVAALLLVLVAVVAPSCGGDGGEETFGVQLMLETFDTAFPTANFGAVATTGTGATMTTAAGVLTVTTTGATSSALSTTSSQFTNPSVSFQLQMSGSAAGLNGTGRINILDNTLATVASMDWNTSTGTITYIITGDSTAEALAANGTLNLFRFQVDANGNATWSRSNVLKATKPGFPAGQLRMQIGASFGAGPTWPDIVIDNVTVTSP